MQTSSNNELRMYGIGVSGAEKAPLSEDEGSHIEAQRREGAREKCRKRLRSPVSDNRGSVRSGVSSVAPGNGIDYFQFQRFFILLIMENRSNPSLEQFLFLRTSMSRDNRAAPKTQPKSL
jgi:hypothetical protein